MSVPFLATIVKAPDKDYWGGVKLVMKYIKGTLGAKLTMIADSFSVINCWVDELFYMHNNFRVPTGEKFLWEQYTSQVDHGGIR